MCNRCDRSLPRSPFRAYVNGEPLEELFCSKSCADDAAEYASEVEWAYRMEAAGFGPHEPYQVCWGHEVEE